MAQELRDNIFIEGLINLTDEINSTSIDIKDLSNEYSIINISILDCTDDIYICEPIIINPDSNSNITPYQYAVIWGYTGTESTFYSSWFNSLNTYKLIYQIDNRLLLEQIDEITFKLSKQINSIEFFEEVYINGIKQTSNIYSTKYDYIMNKEDNTIIFQYPPEDDTEILIKYIINNN